MMKLDPDIRERLDTSLDDIEKDAILRITEDFARYPEVTADMLFDTIEEIHEHAQSLRLNYELNEKDE